MTTMLAPEEPRSCPSSDWTLDPLAQWTGEFDHWISCMSGFRKMENEVFFASRNQPAVRRMHRGEACRLIFLGEQLGVKLGNLRLDTAEAKNLGKALDAFLQNLQSTIAAWHSDLDDVCASEAA